LKTSNSKWNGWLKMFKHDQNNQLKLKLK
jgi:hypothetical protein